MGVYPYGTGVTISEEFTVEGVPSDPTTVLWTLIDPVGIVHAYADSDPEFVHVDVGSYQLDLPGTLHVVPGIWHYEIVGTGAVEATNMGEYTILQGAVPVAVPYAEDGPCTPWCDANDVWTSCGSPTVDPVGSLAEPVPVDMTPYVYAASSLLWQLSARLYSGRCEKTVRPCSDRPCGFQVLSRGHVVWPDDLYVLYGWNGMGWDYGGNRGCGCTPLDWVELSGYPVREIVEVKIDGTVVPKADNWRLDKRRFLTRTADVNGNAQRWPACQREDMNDTEIGTFSVTYAYGQDPPLLGRLAAAQLACEIYQAGPGGGECKLPTGTVRVTRQGITIDRLATLGWFKQASVRFGPQARWQTGIPLVDAFLNSSNPYGLSRRPVMMAPGNRRGRFAQPVGP